MHSRLLAIAMLAAAGSAQVTWTNATPATGPITRKYCTMVWDSVRQNVVLFGGQRDLSTYFDDTWKWDGVAWTQAVPTRRPLAREDHMLAFDTARGRAVLFGGHDVNVNFLNDTWEWDGVDWIPMNPVNRPLPRAYGAMAFDPRRRVVVFQGGLNQNLVETPDTWEWNGTDWRQRFTHTSPGPLAYHSMCWDPNTQRVILYGGANQNGWSDAMWAFDGSDWTRLNPSPAGPSVMDHRMVFDSRRNRIVLWGGQLQPADKTWEYDGQGWVQRTLTGTVPPARRAHTMAFDEARGVAVVFGGWNGGSTFFGDTWVYGPVEPASIRMYGSGCAGSTGTPALRTARNGDRPWLGESVTLRVQPVPASQPAVLFIGLSDRLFRGITLPLELSIVGMPGCSMLTSTELFLPMVASSGMAETMLVIPNDENIPGLTLYAQAFVRDPGSNTLGFVVSDAAAIHIGAK